MVFFTEKPSRVLAACCRVDVMNGALGLVRVGRSSRDFTTEGPFFQPGKGCIGYLAVIRPEILFAVLDELEAQRTLRPFPLQIGEDFPVLLRNERADLPLPLHHQAHGHRLHPARQTGRGPLWPRAAATAQSQPPDRGNGGPAGRKPGSCPARQVPRRLPEWLCG